MVTRVVEPGVKKAEVVGLFGLDVGLVAPCLEHEGVRGCAGSTEGATGPLWGRDDVGRRIGGYCGGSRRWLAA